MPENLAKANGKGAVLFGLCLSGVWGPNLPLPRGPSRPQAVLGQSLLGKQIDF